MRLFSGGWLRPSHSVRSVVILGGLILAFVQTMTAYEIWRQYNNTIFLAERNLNILADVLAGEVGRIVLSVDAVIERTTVDLSTQSHRPAAQSRQVMRDRATGIEAIFGLMVVDGSGNALASLHAFSLRHQAFAEAVRDAANGSLRPFYIGTPIPDPFDSTPVIPFSRVRHNASGQVDGLTIATMSVQFFRELLLQIKSLPGASLTLARQDGSILAQTPEGNGASMADMPEFQPYAKDSGLVHGGSNIGADDTDQRIAAFRTLRPYGLKLSVAIDSDDLLAIWRSNALRLILGDIAASLLLGLMLIAMLRGLRRDEATTTHERETERDRLMTQFALDHSADMVIWANSQSTIVYANRAAHDRLSYQAEALIGRKVGDIDPDFPQDEWEQRMDALREAQTLRFESTLRDSLGHHFPAEVAVGLFHLDGEDYTCAIIRDIVERKRTEAILAERSRRLEASNAELEQFAYVASHDLREPLRMVSSFVSLLAKRFDEQLDDQTREYVKFARQGAQRMDRLILDLLEYSRVGTDSRPLVPVSLGQVVADTHHNLSIALTEVGASLTVPAELPVVWGDADELGRLLLNLIGNALKYRHPDRPPEIELRVEVLAGQVTCMIRDNGIGVAPQYFERIFRIFQRLHDRERYEGTGIGLAVCKKIVERHGGRIWVASIPDPGPEQGTTFYFTLRSAAAS